MFRLQHQPTLPLASALFLLLAAATSASDIVVTPATRLCSSGECDGATTIGAAISNITSFDNLSDGDIAVIRQALVKHKVIYFHGVGHLFTPATQLSFALRFGSVQPEVSKVPTYVEKGVHQSTHSVRHDKRTGQAATVSVNTMVEANKPANKMWKGEKMPARMARLVREPGDPFAFGEGYHADVTFFEQPPFFTFLQARELPGAKDDTYFIDAVKAYETLPNDLKREITGLSCLHNDSAGMANVHPMVRTHPESGEQALYANSHFVHEVIGYPKNESKALLDRVFDHIENQPVFKFKWTCDVEKCGTTCPSCMHALMWDNRQLQHTATTHWAHDDVLNKRRRELHRVTISGGEPPFFRPDGLRKTMLPSSACRV
jgi:alpha-ketoglutarate-dependent taurine dioxygenase